MILVCLIAAGAGAWVYKDTGFENDPDKTVLDPATQTEIRQPKPKEQGNIFKRTWVFIDNFFTNVTMLSIWLATRLKFLF